MIPEILVLTLDKCPPSTAKSSDSLFLVFRQGGNNKGLRAKRVLSYYRDKIYVTDGTKSQSLVVSQSIRSTNMGQDR